MRFNLLILCLAQVYNTRARSVDFVYLTKGFFRSENGLQPSCLSQIYCESDLLKDVQLSHIYPDSKIFVDKKLKFTESEILENYSKLKQSNNNQVPSNPELQKFVDENFEDGDELEKWIPTDFTENPSIVNRIRDPNYQNWAKNLNHVWKTLARKIKKDVYTHPDRYSLIWVPNGFIIPGGRFKELYYWDTYWIVKGLLLCDMRQTAKGVIDNIISMVNVIGFMPNGGRVYYLNRTQPPMLILMVLSYFQATNDKEYVNSVLPVLEAELNYWMENRMISFDKNGKTYTMARYYAPSRGPRPESYREDYEIAETLQSEKEKEEFYINIKSGAETGWDFSSRWFINANGSHEGGLVDVNAPSIIPVDLNSILHVNALTLSTWFIQLGDAKKGTEYQKIADDLLIGIQEVMWRPDKGAWFDWDIINNKNRESFYISNVVPLWTGSYSMPKKAVASSVLGYLKDQHIIEPDYSIKYNGTPTSLYSSSQQWDFPNAWPPLQAFIIQGLDRTQQKLAQQVAADLADVWLRSNYKGFSEKSMMFEKYDVLASGETGAGGEYTPQTGFGWSNGIVFEFLDRWGDASYDKKNELRRDG
ncbi:trehalase-like isoform X2 [Daktulosphaira vitifoliae]|uniref:trehalase-like isoform X2 n=1 Tax=Daktulosphaira vitifoliae TaxID=58002 RepID=UPI0021AA3BAA|nr:trehalase-like isoform X2 [Daktulosphaira vitifoliae]